jgi:hypothetical protein
MGQLGRVWSVKGVELKREVIGEGETKREFFLEFKGR